MPFLDTQKQCVPRVPRVPKPLKAFKSAGNQHGTQVATGRNTPAMADKRCSSISPLASRTGGPPASLGVGARVFGFR
jgi:hypothetical protein